MKVRFVGTVVMETLILLVIANSVLLVMKKISVGAYVIFIVFDYVIN